MTGADWRSGQAARDAAERAAQGREDARALESEGGADAPSRMLDALARAAADVLTMVPRDRAALLACAMTEAIGDLSRAPIGDAGAVLSAAARLDSAMAELVSDVRGARAAHGSAA